MPSPSPARPTALRSAALFLTLGAALSSAAVAQRHNGLSSPPTAPHPHPLPAPIVPVSSGLGTLQIVPVNYGVPAPQSLTRQLQAEDDRTRIASLSAIGAPAQYLNRGHVPFPHSINLDFAPLGTSDELDALLTVELDQHIVSAVLVPQGDSWHRVATVIYPTPFADPNTTPATFLRLTRSVLQHERYRAVFRATAAGSDGDFTENEAHLRILNNKPAVLISFVSAARTCNEKSKHSGCDLVRRWLQPDPDDPSHHLILVTATGRLSAHEAAETLAASSIFQQAHLRTFSCQPYVYSEATEQYEPTANATPCSPAAK